MIGNKNPRLDVGRNHRSKQIGTLTILNMYVLLVLTTWYQLRESKGITGSFLYNRRINDRKSCN